MSGGDAAAMLARAQELLAAGDAVAATAAFTEAHGAAGDDPPVAALAMLGRAQGEFALGLLGAAARHADQALQMLTLLAMPQAQRATDLTAQIEHYRYLQDRG